MIKSITIRIILIISMLTSMQASASMVAAMAVASQSKFHTKTACADMPGMATLSDSRESTSSSKSDISGCDHDACCQILATNSDIASTLEKSVNNYHQISVKSPTRFIKINFRPPVLV